MTAHHADFIAKLRQIEELAAGVHGELPQSLLVETAPSAIKPEKPPA
ncbi:MAG TPA: hypothetical protein VIG70_09250 [Burkholderiales bacterium]|jgi:hypothetical protein